MYLLEDIEFNKQPSNPGAGVTGQALLNNGFYYSVILFDTFTDWKDIGVLEDQYTNEQMDAIEKELFSIYRKNRIVQ